MVLVKTQSKQMPALAKRVALCSGPATAYGKCIAQHYQNMQKDACLREFMALKECVQAKR